MSELDVIVIHIRAEQAAEYERLFAERELPRWRDYKARGAFLSARLSRVAFGTDNREGIAKYVVAVEVPSHAGHSEHDADPGFQEFNHDLGDFSYVGDFPALFAENSPKQENSPRS